MRESQSTKYIFKELQTLLDRRIIKNVKDTALLAYVEGHSNGEEYIIE